MFERLTKKVFICGVPYFINTVGNDIEAENMTTYQMGMALNRLATYEDSGLSPEEVVEIKKYLNMWIEICKENNVSIVQFKKWAEAEQDGRLVMLPCKVGELMEKYRELTESEGADEAETYTTGYRNGHRNGQIELLAYLLQIDTGCREAAEKAIAVIGGGMNG